MLAKLQSTMQLTKFKTRKMPTFDNQNPQGIHRRPEDYNQRANTAQVHRNALGDSFPEKKIRVISVSK